MEADSAGSEPRPLEGDWPEGPGTFAAVTAAQRRMAATAGTGAVCQTPAELRGWGRGERPGGKYKSSLWSTLFFKSTLDRRGRLEYFILGPVEHR